MSSSTDAVRFISPKGLMRLCDMWLERFHEDLKSGRNENAERWFNVVLDFLSARGDEVVPRVVREQEERVLSLGKSQEYVAALVEVVNSANTRSEYEWAVLVLTASPEERAQALNKVLGA